jgi:hypothetical protein
MQENLLQALDQDDRELLMKMAVENQKLPTKDGRNQLSIVSLRAVQCRKLYRAKKYW